MYVSARGLTTTPIPYGSRLFEIELDFLDHRLGVRTSDGTIRTIALRAQAVADFYRDYMDALAALGIAVKLWPVPVEVDAAIPFEDDRVHTSYDPAQARRFFEILLQADRVSKRFKGRFLGKSSPVHFFWGAFDLALTRFSGRRAPSLAPASGRPPPTTVGNSLISSCPMRQSAPQRDPMKRSSISTRACTPRPPTSLAGIAPRSIGLRPNGPDQSMASDS